MKAHDWVSEVEQPAPIETVSGQLQEQLGGEVSSGKMEMEENKTEGEQQEEMANRGEDERRGEEEKERDPRSVQVR